MEIPKNARTFALPTSTVWFDKDGILCPVSKKVTQQAVKAFSETVANIFLALYPPNYPVKLFSDEASAKEWLKQCL